MAEMHAGSHPVPGGKILRPRLWRELAFYAAMVMELSWVALWCRILLRATPQITYGRTFLVLAGIVLVAYGVASGAEWVNLRVVLRRALLAVVLLISIIVGLETLIEEYGSLNVWELLSRPVRTFREMAGLVPVEFILMVLVLGLGWRGITLVGRYVEPAIVIGGFRTGIFALFLFGILVPEQEEPAILALAIFLFSSLLAMSAARIAVLGQLRGGQSIPFDRRWLGGILLVVSTVVAIAWLVARAMQGVGFEVLSRIFTSILIFLVLLLSPLLWLVFRFITLVGQWLNLASMIDAFIEIVQNLQEFLENLLALIARWFERLDTNPLDRMVQFLEGARPYFLWGTIIFFLLLVLLSIQRYMRRRDVDPEEQEYEALPMQKDLFGLLRDALRRGLERMRDELEKMGQLRLARRFLAAARIRRIYARLMDLSTRLGQPRPASRTPLEFLPSLKALFPALEGDLQTITSAYLRVRYGELPELQQEVEDVERAWRRISLSGQELLKSRRKTNG